ncbi:MAG TPA: DUF72 domain-containing protein [Nitrososphaeraceae archaeon]|jgi:uncharacterized protein YecE (DUF72 family)
MLRTVDPSFQNRLVQADAKIGHSDQLKFQLLPGCSGWSHEAWKGKFYPSNLDSSSWLNYYSKIFNLVEIDSSYYVIPDRLVVKNWYRKTPLNFKFTAKFPRVITHDKMLVNVKDEMNYFLESMRELGDKLLCLIIQMPTSVNISEGLELLERFLPRLDPTLRYAVEVRNSSWFQGRAYDFFARNNICMVWSRLQDLQTPPVVTTDFVYLRLIGDRSTNNYGKVLQERKEELQYWTNKINQIGLHEETANRVKKVIVSATNSFTGFGPNTVNSVRKSVGLQELQWVEKSGFQKKISEYETPRQSKLHDF